VPEDVRKTFLFFVRLVWKKEHKFLTYIFFLTKKDDSRANELLGESITGKKAGKVPRDVALSAIKKEHY
jgi:hypothetical protein